MNLALSVFDAQLERKLLATLIALSILWLLRYVTLQLIQRNRPTESQNSHSNWRRSLAYAALILSLGVIGRIWLQLFVSAPLLVALLLGALAIALREMLLNLAGRLYLAWKKPFSIGDRIEIQDQSGEVTEIGALSFTLWTLERTGHAGLRVQIPCGLLLKQSFGRISGRFDFVWSSLAVRLTRDSNWEKARLVMQLAARKHTATAFNEACQALNDPESEAPLNEEQLRPTVSIAVVDAAIELTLRFLTTPATRHNSEQLIWETLLQEFGQRRHEIQFAPPQPEASTIERSNRVQPDNVVYLGSRRRKIDEPD